MTREEAIIIIERVAHTEAKWPGTEDTLEALDMALTALRPVSREQVEKVWRGEWKHKNSPFDYKIFVCKQCGKQISIQGENLDFCPACGAAQTDKAVDIIMRRLETLYETT